MILFSQYIMHLSARLSNSKAFFVPLTISKIIMISIDHFINHFSQIAHSFNIKFVFDAHARKLEFITFAKNIKPQSVWLLFNGIIYSSKSLFNYEAIIKNAPILMRDRKCQEFLAIINTTKKEINSEMFAAILYNRIIAAILCNEPPSGDLKKITFI